MTAIRYIDGDATRPVGSSSKIIAHICNDVGAWGHGFVVSVSQEWPEVEYAYRNWHRLNDYKGTPFELGKVQFVDVMNAPITCIANMIAQHGLISSENRIPIKYDKLRECLELVCEEALSRDLEVHMPKIGSGLAGGKWPIIESIIISTLCSRDVKVIVYQLT